MWGYGFEGVVIPLVENEFEENMQRILTCMAYGSEFTELGVWDLEFLWLGVRGLVCEKLRSFGFCVCGAWGFELVGPRA